MIVQKTPDWLSFERCSHDMGGRPCEKPVVVGNRGGPYWCQMHKPQDQHSGGGEMSFEADPADGIVTIECPKCHAQDKKCDQCGGVGMIRKPPDLNSAKEGE